MLRLGVLALLWGSSFFWIKIALTGLTPMQIAVGRIVLGAAVLTALLLIKGQRLPQPGAVWGHLAIAALFGNVIPFVLFGIAEQSVDSSVAGVLNATTPLWALAIGLVLGFESRSNIMRLIGLGLGFGGAVLIFAPWQGNNLMSWGALLCLAAAASYGVSYVYIGKALSGRGLSTVQLASAQLLAATVLSAAITPISGGIPQQWSWQPILAVTILGIFGTGIAFVINYKIIEDEGPTNAATVGYLLPVVSILLGAIFLGEALSFQIIIGMLIVLAGIALTRRSTKISKPKFGEVSVATTDSVTLK